MKAEDFEDIMRLYLSENDMGIPYRSLQKDDGYCDIDISYEEKIYSGTICFVVTQRENNGDFDFRKRTDTIYLTDILLFIATY